MEQCTAEGIRFEPLGSGHLSVSKAIAIVPAVSLEIDTRCVCFLQLSWFKRPTADEQLLRESHLIQPTDAMQFTYTGTDNEADSGGNSQTDLLIQVVQVGYSGVETIIGVIGTTG